MHENRESADRSPSWGERRLGKRFHGCIKLFCCGVVAQLRSRNKGKGGFIGAVGFFFSGGNAVATQERGLMGAAGFSVAGWKRGRSRGAFGFCAAGWKRSHNTEKGVSSGEFGFSATGWKRSRNTGKGGFMGIFGFSTAGWKRRRTTGNKKTVIYL